MSMYITRNTKMAVDNCLSSCGSATGKGGPLCSDRRVAIWSLLGLAVSMMSMDAVDGASKNAAEGIVPE